MKKALLILAITFGIQTMNAHPHTTGHAHESILHEWSWVLIPAIIACGLIWKFSKKSYSSSKR